MKTLFSIALMGCLPYLLFSQNKEMCITIDDLPVVHYSIKDPAHLDSITSKLIQTFNTYEIPAIGFVNEKKLYKNGKVDAAKLTLLEEWLKNGYELGNHTYAHSNYNRVGYEAFTKDILQGEQICKPLVEKYDAEYQFFRHPYLRVGNTKEEHDQLNAFLKEHHYIESPVTIDNDDYLFAKAYHNAYEKEDEDLMEKIGSDYIAYMEQKLRYFEASAKTLFNRDIKQILLLHANLLNAEYLDDLAAMYKRYGYTFIDQEAALNDPCYESEISRYGDWGISWLDRWALSQGKKGDFFKGDPATPQYIVDLANL